jgi:hypothetical protein
VPDIRYVNDISHGLQSPSSFYQALRRRERSFRCGPATL